MKIEYRVRPVTRYQVTRFHQEGNGAGCETRGEFDNAQVARQVAEALATAEGGKFHIARDEDSWVLTELSPFPTERIE